MKKGRVEYRCSFCGKTQQAVHRLIAGPGGVYICNECIDLCREIIDEEQAMKGRPAPDDARGAHGGQWVSSSGRARHDAGEPTSPRPSEDPDASGRTEAAAIPASQRQMVDDALRARLVPLVAELEETRASLERLARENGMLRERLQSREDGTER